MGLSWLSTDGKKLLVTRILRTFAYGYLGVVLALYLDKLGLDPTQIGVVLTAAIAGSTLMTVLWSLVADRVGRRKTIATMAILMTVGGMVFALTDNFLILVLAGFTGTISATSAEVGVFQTVETAVLPQTAPNERRTWLFSIYNMLGNLAGAMGSLAAASVGYFAAIGLQGTAAYRPLFILYALIGLANLAIFVTLSDKIELAKIEGEKRFIGIHRSQGVVVKLSGLFAIDSFAGGLCVQSIVSYWFYLRWGLPLEDLALIFFWVGVLSGLSLLAAPWLAHRIGLLNTMVFTHLPSNIFLILVPLAPTAWLAVVFFLLRMSVSQMDVPTRQSYMMAVVDSDERTATSGITNVARSFASAISPTFAGMAFSSAALSTPFFVSGALKIVYDALVWRTFHNVRPPEEEAIRRERAAARSAAR